MKVCDKGHYPREGYRVAQLRLQAIAAPAIRAIERALCWKKQSAIEVMAISRFAFQIVSRRHSRSGQHHATQNSCVMAAGRDQHEAVPNGLLEGQSSPKVKTDPGRIEQAPNSDQNRRPSVYRAEHGSHPDQDRPA